MPSAIGTSDATEIIERRAAISGVGQSAVGRRLGRPALDLTIDACLEAIADAGLTTKEIDGLSTYPGLMDVPPGFSGVGVPDVQDALRLELGWFSGGPEVPSQLAAVVNACLAVASGLANHVLCFRTVTESTAQGGGGRSAVLPGGSGGMSVPKAGGFMQWSLPFAAPSAAIWIAMFAQRHMHEFGTTREQLGQLALNARRNAGLNPKGVYRDPMSMEDYLSARMISEPFCLYDCDVPVDGSTAVIVSRIERTKDLRKVPIRIEAVGTALRGRPSWDQFDDLTTMAMRDAGAQLWTRTDLKPSDVQLAELYDGFSFLALSWLEALNFCGKGEGGPFVEGGQRIAIEGELPVNTHGGQLSAGRLHGYGLFHEACLQLWGEGGDRQVPGNPQVAMTAAGGGPMAAALLLTRA